MKILIESLLLLTLVSSAGCASEKMQEPAREAAALSDKASRPGGVVAALEPAPSVQMQARGGGGGAAATPRYSEEQVSLAEAATAEAVSQATARKIIRNAELSIEIEAPKEAQARIASIAESLGGFVVTSEFKQSGSAASKPTETVTVVVRVPSSEFNAALEAIRGTGNRVIHEKVTGQDVTEEYIDLEARIRTQKALEGQFLEIMKQARKVEDALEVQRELAEVRSEIERLEGRRRFLDNKSSLSTITVTLQTPAPLVAATTSGFGHDVREAFGDGIDTAVQIVLGLIRFVIVLVPVAVLILLPGWLLLRQLIKRRWWPKKQEPLAVTPSE